MACVSKIGSLYEMVTKNVIVSTTNTIFGINPRAWIALPCEGLILLKIRQVVPTAGSALPVQIAVPANSTVSTVGADTCCPVTGVNVVNPIIVNFCRSNNIGTIIIGLNKEWKQEINIGRRNNQHFVSIPHSKLIDKIVYKAKLLGINVVIHEESYTSKIDHLAFEPLKKQESYLGKRKKRGLFQSSIGKLINADINGAIGIARKVIGDSFIGKIIDSGFVFNPIRVNTL